LPAIPADAQVIFDAPGLISVIDLGGDDRGALALGRYSEKITASPYEMWLVVNQRRPMTRGSADTVQIKSEIEAASGVKFTGLVNNTNLGTETTAKLIAESFHFTDELSRETGLPVVMTSARRGIAEEIAPLCETPVFPLDIFEKYSWKVN
jgi:hypothetical protein